MAENTLMCAYCAHWDGPVPNNGPDLGYCTAYMNLRLATEVVSDCQHALDRVRKALDAPKQQAFDA